MKILIVLCSIIAFGQAKPSWSYSTVDVANPAFYSAHGIIGARSYISAPAFATAPGLLATRTFAAAPVITAAAPAFVGAPVIAAAPAVVEARVAAAPVVAAAPAVVEARTAVVDAPVVVEAPAVVEARTAVVEAPAVVETRTAVAAGPVIAAAPLAVAVATPAAVKTQYHAQDELGQASYGHSEPLQTHNAVQDVHGNKVGSFSYLNPTDGLVHRTDYVADALGYRVAANDLPVAPSGPIADTPEVVIARNAHLEAVRRARRSVVVAAHTPASTAPLATPIIATAPLITAYAAPASTILSAPAAISYAAAPAAISYAAAPVVRDAILTTVVNTPGHAVSYRVD